MRTKQILIPAVTVAEWGGLHEWVAECVGWLVEAGHKATVVGRGERFSIAVRNSGGDFLEIPDWSSWRLSYHELLNSVATEDFDLVFTHGPQARFLGMELGGHLNIPVHVMIHGAYHDYAFEWFDQVESFIVASPSLRDYLTNVAKVPTEMIRVVPNGLPSTVEGMSPIHLETKLSEGIGHIATASRLDHDKVSQIPVTLEVLEASTRSRPDVHWQLDVYGDGRLKSHFQNVLSSAVSTFPNASVLFHGWVAPDEIPHRMQEASIAIVAGLGGMRSIATGTLCVAVGARDSLGVQFGRNLEAGVYSNFGDHGAQGYLPSQVASDVSHFLANSNLYNTTVAEVRDYMLNHRAERLVRRLLFEALGLL